ncbi:MAG TPA: AAA family ATPase, partial [Planctomycetota bacterium]|nr:AAA family ATPase [Planctomycetota bacterium]
MFLKRLELFGFKSFADRTVVDFTGGVTALVGPNGCGKSNVVDSIRWALGEQSARSLRGSEMVDLIFNGTANRRPLGFAEVVLTFDNARRQLPVDSPEVSVTRRLYRTGECEYLINGQACRLRDVRDLFMDTGVGVGAYSIIEQGKIDALLQSSPKERRGIFEEAAGIAKYRSRKAAALRKLERVEQNLLRVGDVAAEVERQLRSVQRQAAKARRYRELAEELKSLRLTVLGADYRAMAEKREALTADLAAAEDLAASLSAEGGRLEAAIAEAQARADELERASSEAERKRSEDRARLARVEATIAAAEGLARQHEETAARAAREADELLARAAEAEADEARARGEYSAATTELGALTGRLSEAEAAAAAGAARAAELAASIEKRKGEAIEVVRRRAGVDSQVSKLLSEIGHFDAEISRSEQHAGALSEKLAAAREEVEHGRTRVEELGRRRAAVADEIKAARAGEAAAAAEVSELDRRASRLASELSARRSRLHILSDLEARQEGIQAGVKGVLSAMREGSAPAGLCGMVADLVRVREQFEVAIETALGHKV